MSSLSLPYPPYHLGSRVGSLDEADDPWAYYDALGTRAKRSIMAALPPDWSFESKRVLDFGCGAGRTLRHFIAEADVAEMHGCDIDHESVAWLEANLSPPFHVFANGDTPPLDRPDDFFDLIWVVSVFTHLVDTWADWLLELHRVLRPGGLLLATFMGRGMSELIAQEPWHEDRVGMSVLRYGESWDVGGPMVLHSPWWLRAHWGRLFAIVDIHEDGFAVDHDGPSQGLVVAKKDERSAVDREALDRPDPHEPREAIALRHGQRRLLDEVAGLRRHRDGLLVQIDADRDAIQSVDALRAYIAELEHRATVVESSRSWALTRPLRRLAAVARGRRFGRTGTPRHR
jgi:SAM-dependent methyltransferase